MVREVLGEATGGEARASRASDAIQASIITQANLKARESGQASAL